MEKFLVTLALSAIATVLPKAAWACAACASRPNNNATLLGLGAMMALPLIVAGVVWVALPKDGGPGR